MLISIPRFFATAGLVLLLTACGRPNERPPEPTPGYPAPEPVLVQPSPPPKIESFVLIVTILADAIPLASSEPYVDPSTGEWVTPPPEYTAHDELPLMATSVRLSRSDGADMRLSDSASAPTQMERNGERYRFTFRYFPDQIEGLTDAPLSSISAFDRLETDYGSPLVGHDLRFAGIEAVALEVNGRRVVLSDRFTTATTVQLGQAFRAAASEFEQAS